MKKVLIISYYWPPSGGSGVQRWLKFVKYLRDFGWEPIIYTVEDGEYPIYDETLFQDIPGGITTLRRKIWEPYSLYKRVIGQKQNKNVVSGFISDGKMSLSKKFSLWVRGNLFIPDARMFWIRPSIRFLTKYLKNNPVDLIVSSGPPHSMHLIALGLKKSTNLPWVADFRDPWTKISYFQDLMPTSRTLAKHENYENEVLRIADEVVVVGRAMSEEFEKIREGNINIVTNGFDEDDFIGLDNIELDSKFTIVHTGMIAKSQNHPVFFEAIGELVKSNNQFSEQLNLIFVGKTDVSLQNSIIANDLQSVTEYIDYLDHSLAIKRQRSAQVLYLAINDIEHSKAIITGKIFEYLASGRPIICIGPEDGDAAAIVNETKSGKVSDWRDKAKIKEIIMSFFESYLAGKLENEGVSVGKFARRSLTQKMAHIFDEAITK